MSDSDLIRLLQSLANDFERVPFPKERPFDAFVFMQKAGLIAGQMNLKDEIYAGFKPAAGITLRAVAEELRKEDGKYVRNVDKGKFIQATINALHAVLHPEPTNLTIAPTHLASLRAQIANWWTNQSAQRRFAVPCALMPHHISPIVVGPIEFKHVSDFVAYYQQWNNETEIKLNLGSMLDQMERRYAAWVAEISIADMDLAHGQLVADMAVDIGLTALQITTPDLELAARITGRARPGFRADVYSANNKPIVGLHNNQPGLVMPPNFASTLQKLQPSLDSAGRRISTYINGGTSLLPLLEQAWCDAALWYHEGVADQLNTIAVAKMETSIEVLMRSVNSSGSAKRIRKVFWAFANKGPNDPVAPGQQKVTQLSKEIVTARSRVLHGTLSTLLADTDDSRAAAQGIAQQLLQAYTIQLDEYLKDPSAADDTDLFLDWVHARLYP
jgi:hypothetical protein